MATPAFLATQITDPILPLYIVQKGATTFELGIIVSLLSFVAVTAKIPLGILSEKIGRWPVLLASVVGQTISLLLYSIAPSIVFFYPIRIFHAITIATLIPTALTLTQELAPSGKRGDIIGRLLAFIGMTTMIGPFLCTFFVTYVDYAQLIQLAAIFPLLGLFPFLLIRRKKIHDNSTSERNLSVLFSLKTIISSRNVLILTYLRFSFSFTFAFFITFFAVYAENNLLLFPSVIAFLFGIRGAASMVSRIPSGKLSDRIGCKLPIISAFALLTLSYFIISVTADIFLIILAVVVHGLAHGMRAVAEWTMLGESAPTESVNLASAYISSIFDIGLALGAVTAGALVLVFNIPAIFILASLITLTGTLFVGFLKTSDKTN